MGAGLDDSALNVDGEGIHLPEEQGSEAVPAAVYGRTVGAGIGEGEGSRRIWRIEDIERFPANIDASFEGVATMDESESVEEFSDGGGEV